MEKTVLPQKNLQGIWEFITGYEPAFFDVQIGDRWHFQYNVNPSNPAVGKVDMFRAGTLYKSGSFIQREFQDPGPHDYDLEINLEGIFRSYKITTLSETRLTLQSPAPYRYPATFDKVQSKS